MSNKIYEQVYALAKLLFFMFFVSNSHAQYIFKNDAVPEKFSLHNFTTLADVGARKLDIKYVIAHYSLLNPIKPQTENDDLGFTQNNFWTKTTLVNNTDAPLIYYLETARPITDVVE